MRIPFTTAVLVATGIVFFTACIGVPQTGEEDAKCFKNGTCQGALVCGADKLCVKWGGEDAGNHGRDTGKVPTDAGHKDQGTGGDDLIPDVAMFDAASTDVAPDATTDATMVDSGTDAGEIDSGDAAQTGDGDTDAELTDTTTSDANEDGGIDSGSPDTTEDAGIDVGTDTGADTGADAGCAPDCSAACNGGSDGCGGTCEGPCVAGKECVVRSCVACGGVGNPCCGGTGCDGTNSCNGTICVSNTCVGQPNFTPCQSITEPDFEYDVCLHSSCYSPGCNKYLCGTSTFTQNTHVPHFKLPDTNQRKCYDDSAEIACPIAAGGRPCATDGTPAFCGQDAQYGWDAKHAASERFIISEEVQGQPIVKDKVTGLVWAQYETNVITNENPLTPCNDLDWGGYRDWHTADRAEFQSTMDYDSVTPLVSAGFPSAHNEYRTSTTYQLADGYHWNAIGVGSFIFTQNGGFVRCVRGGETVPSRWYYELALPNGKTVTIHNVTGLAWEPIVDAGSNCISQTRQWGEVLQYCEALQLGGYSDWRAPSVVELGTLVIGGGGGGPCGLKFWSSTTFVNNGALARTVSLGSGEIDGAGKATQQYSICVRDRMKAVTSGEFVMGCDDALDGTCLADDKPQHSVGTGSYLIDTHEVTVLDYRDCVTAGKCSPPSTGGNCNYYLGGKDMHPVNCVDFYQAKGFCEWNGLRLPTEAEWERAARGDSPGSKFPWGSDPLDCDHAWNVDCVPNGTVANGAKPASASSFGVEDMLGNAAEWVADWYDPSYYATSPGNDPTGPSSGTLKVVRGGSWANDASFMRISRRNFADPTTFSSQIGFRCAR